MKSCDLKKKSSEIWLPKEAINSGDTIWFGLMPRSWFPDYLPHVFTAFHSDIQVMWCNKASLFEFNKAAYSTVEWLSQPHLHQFTAARISAGEISRCHGGAAFLGSRHLKGGRATSRSKQTSSGAFYLYLVSTAPPQLLLKLETLSEHGLRAVLVWSAATHPLTLNFPTGVLVLNDTECSATHFQQLHCFCYMAESWLFYTHSGEWNVLGHFFFFCW